MHNMKPYIGKGLCLRGNSLNIYHRNPEHLPQNSVVNVQGITSEAKDVFLPLYKVILPVYMRNFYIRCEEQGAPLVTPM